ncbi:hypothetical protein V6N13_106474 [Hibiscus sabdariffa]
MCFVEPRINMATADRALAALNFPNSFRVEANGFSGGIWLCWFDNIRIDVLFSHFQFIQCRITNRVDNGTCLATFVYASPQSSKQKPLWDYLRTLPDHILEPWNALGDFIATLSSEERQGCRNRAGPDTQFVNVGFDAGLHDLGFHGPNFTWYKGNCIVCLDRVLCNDQWLETFLDSLVSHLLPEWNRVIFGSLSRRKQAIMARLRGIQKSIDKFRNPFLIHLESKLQLELEQILDQEGLLWKQKSRADWIAFGDRNTSYFHKKSHAQ